MIDERQTILIDTHVLAWWLLDDARLGEAARAAIATADRRVLVSAASLWELATKHQRGRWPEVGAFLDVAPAALRDEQMDVLPITLAHALAAARLDWPHRDPFDRMIAAQAQTERAVLVTADQAFAGLDVSMLWA